MSEDERQIYEMVLTLAVYRQERAEWSAANALSFIAKEIANGTHKQIHEGWRKHHYAKEIDQ